MLLSKNWLTAVALAAAGVLLSACEERTTVEKTDTVVIPVPKTEPGPPGPPGPAGAPGPQGEPGKGGDTTVVVPPPAPEPAKEPEKK